MYRNHELQNRFMKHGLKTLEDIEVVELLLGLKLDRKNHRADAKELLKYHSSLVDIIDAPLEELKDSLGFQEHYLLGLRLPHEIANRYLFEKAKEKPILNCSEGVIDYLRHSMKGLKTEYFKVLFLNGRNMLTAEEDVSKGTLTSSAIYPREVVKAALRHDAAALVFAHNHPSGNIRPSQEDFKITNKLCDAANLLDIVVQDLIIIADNSYFSFADRGFIKRYHS